MINLEIGESQKVMAKDKVIQVVPTKISEAGFVAEGGMITAQERQALDAYLSGAVEKMGGKTKSEAKKIAKEFAEGADKSNISALDVRERSADMKKQASQAGLREKINYASDADVSGLSDAMAFGISGVAASMLAPIVAADPQVMGVTFLAATVAYAGKKGVKTAAAELSASKTPEQKTKAAEYADIKHAQLALKQLKKAIEAPLKAAEKAKDKDLINRCFAAGMGNPGGVIATFKDSRGR